MKVKELRELISQMDDNDEITFIHKKDGYSYLLDSIKDSRIRDGEIRIIIEDYLDAYMREL